MSSYSDKLRDPRWQRKRLEIMQRDEFKCTECGDNESTLHVHHTRYLKGEEPWSYPDALLATLCERCHEQIHAGELSMSEELLNVMQRRGGSAFVLGYLMGFIDYRVPDGMRLSYLEWTRAAKAFVDELDEIVRERQ